MELKGFDIPCRIQYPIVFRSEFTIRAVFRIKFAAGRQTIFSKRYPDTKEAISPGIVIWINRRWVEVWTCGHNDKQWSLARTGAGLEVYKKYELMVIRQKDKIRIFINGIDRTEKDAKAAGGDINNTAPAYIGIHDDNKRKRKFYGDIFELGITNDLRLRG